MITPTPRCVCTSHPPFFRFRMARGSLGEQRRAARSTDICIAPSLGVKESLQIHFKRRQQQQQRPALLNLGKSIPWWWRAQQSPTAQRTSETRRKQQKQLASRFSAQETLNKSPKRRATRSLLGATYHSAAAIVKESFFRRVGKTPARLRQLLPRAAAVSAKKRPCFPREVVGAAAARGGGRRLGGSEKEQQISSKVRRGDRALTNLSALRRRETPAEPAVRVLKQQPQHVRGGRCVSTRKKVGKKLRRQVVPARTRANAVSGARVVASPPCRLLLQHRKQTRPTKQVRAAAATSRSCSGSGTEGLSSTGLLFRERSKQTKKGRSRKIESHERDSSVRGRTQSSWIESTSKSGRGDSSSKSSGSSRRVGAKTRRGLGSSQFADKDVADAVSSRAGKARWKRYQSATALRVGKAAQQLKSSRRADGSSTRSSSSRNSNNNHSGKKNSRNHSSSRGRQQASVLLTSERGPSSRTLSNRTEGADALERFSLTRNGRGGKQHTLQQPSGGGDQGAVADALTKGAESLRAKGRRQQPQQQRRERGGQGVQEQKNKRLLDVKKLSKSPTHSPAAAFDVAVGSSRKQSFGEEKKRTGDVGKPNKTSRQHRAYPSLFVKSLKEARTPAPLPARPVTAAKTEAASGPKQRIPSSPSMQWKRRDLPRGRPAPAKERRGASAFVSASKERGSSSQSRSSSRSRRSDSSRNESKNIRRSGSGSHSHRNSSDSNNSDSNNSDRNNSDSNNSDSREDVEGRKVIKRVKLEGLDERQKQEQQQQHVSKPSFLSAPRRRSRDPSFFGITDRSNGCTRRSSTNSSRRTSVVNSRHRIAVNSAASHEKHSVGNVPQKPRGQSHWKPDEHQRPISERKTRKQEQQKEEAQLQQNQQRQQKQQRDVYNRAGRAVERRNFSMLLLRNRGKTTGSAVAVPLSARGHISGQRSSCSSSSSAALRATKRTMGRLAFLRASAATSNDAGAEAKPCCASAEEATAAGGERSACVDAPARAPARSTAALKNKKQKKRSRSVLRRRNNTLAGAAASAASFLVGASADELAYKSMDSRKKRGVSFTSCIAHHTQKQQQLVLPEPSCRKLRKNSRAEERGPPSLVYDDEEERDTPTTTTEATATAVLLQSNPSSAAIHNLQRVNHRNWQSNCMLLYEYVTTHTLEWPSLTVQWMDSCNPRTDCETGQTILVGTHTTGHPHLNYLLLIEVTLPLKPIQPSGMYYDQRKDSVGFEFGNYEAKKFVVTSRIPHQGEANKARFCPFHPTKVASNAINGCVYIFDFSKFGPDVPASPIKGGSAENAAAAGLNSDQQLASAGRRIGAPLAAATNPSDFMAEQADLVLCGHTAEGWGLEWAPAAKPGLLASAADDGYVCIWDVMSFNTRLSKCVQPLYRLTADSRLRPLQAVGWKRHSDGEGSILLAVGDDGFLNTWDTRVSLTPVLRTRCSSSCANALAVNEAAPQVVATAGADKGISVWDLRDLRRPAYRLIYAHSEAVTSLKWDPCEKTILASGSTDRLVKIYDLALVGAEQESEEAEDGPPELLFVHGGHTGGVTDLDWNPQTASFPATIASVSDDNALQIWQPTRKAFQRTCTLYDDFEDDRNGAEHSTALDEDVE